MLEAQEIGTGWKEFHLILALETCTVEQRACANLPLPPCIAFSLPFQLLRWNTLLCPCNDNAGWLWDNWVLLGDLFLCNLSVASPTVRLTKLLGEPGDLGGGWP